jgi:cellulose biosynthesis protein BcsQ
MVITVGGFAGGVGKSFIAANFAIWLTRPKAEVLLIEVDPNNTIAGFVEARKTKFTGEPRLSYLPLEDSSTISAVLRQAKQTYDYIVIDTQSTASPGTLPSMLEADIILFPVVPANISRYANSQTQEFINQVIGDRKPGPFVYAFLNKVESYQTGFSEELSQVTGISILQQSLGARKAFAKSFEVGLSMMEAKDSNRKAFAEIYGLFSAIVEDVGQRKVLRESKLEAENDDVQVVQANNSKKDFANINLTIRKSKLEAITEIRKKKFPVRDGKKRYGISLHDWIIEAIDRELARSAVELQQT